MAETLFRHRVAVVRDAFVVDAFDQPRRLSGARAEQEQPSHQQTPRNLFHPRTSPCVTKLAELRTKLQPIRNSGRRREKLEMRDDARAGATRSVLSLQAPSVIAGRLQLGGGQHADQTGTLPTPQRSYASTGASQRSASSNCMLLRRA